MEKYLEIRKYTEIKKYIEMRYIEISCKNIIIRRISFKMDFHVLH